MADPFRAALAAHAIGEPRLLAHRPLVDCYAASLADGGQRLFIKHLRSSIPKVRRNFRREIAALRTLAGTPGIPHLIAALDDPDLAFHACAFVDAPTLAGLVTSPSADAPRIARALGAVAATIRTVHRAGYAHRDLAPDHILVAGDDAPTIVDFGMARPLGLEDRDLAACATDVQAIAMMAWEALSGRLLFAYRGAPSAAEIDRERTVIDAVLGTDRLGQILSRCLQLRSEFAPEGILPATAGALDALLAQLQRRLQHCARPA